MDPNALWVRFGRRTSQHDPDRLTNARIVDGTAPEPTDPVTVLLEGDRIREVSHRPFAPTWWWMGIRYGTCRC